MLGLKYINKQGENSLEDTVYAIQNGDKIQENELLKSYKPFIAKTVSSVCKRYIDESDDEFSIGLIAFNDAIQKYSPDKGASLLSFAEVIIRNRVIDFIRKQAKYQDTTIYFNNVNDEDTLQSNIEANLSYDDYLEKNEQANRQEEIVHFSNLLSEYHLSFRNLVKHSPKHADARKSAMQIAKLIAESDEMKNYLIEKKRLPIKFLEGKVDVSRKTIERNRKYIIAITLIFLNDYFYLKDYIKGVLNS